MDEGLIFCTFFLVSRDVVLPILRPRDSSYLPEKERSKRKGNLPTRAGPLQNPGQSGAVFGRSHMLCLQDGTPGQVGILVVF